MIIYPAIDLRGGRVVRLTEGKFDQEKSYGDDPLAVDKEFAAAGATWLHVVDLDGAKDPTKRQTPLRRPIIMKRPLSSVVAVNVCPLSGCSAVMVAPLMAWPPSSFTTPATRPIWALAGMGSTTTISADPISHDTRRPGRMARLSRKSFVAPVYTYKSQVG